MAGEPGPPLPRCAPVPGFESGLELCLHLGRSHGAGRAGRRLPLQELGQTAGGEMIQPDLNGGPGPPGQPGEWLKGMLTAGGPVHHLQSFLVARISCRTDPLLELALFRRAHCELGSSSGHAQACQKPEGMTRYIYRLL